MRTVNAKLDLVLQSPIDWPGIRAAAVTIGVREAARQAAADMPENERKTFIERVMKRSSREGWIVRKTELLSAPRTVPENTASAPVRSGADSIAQALADDNSATKTGFSRAARTVAEAAASYDAPKVLENSRALRDVATIAGQVHGWNEREGDDRRVMINIGILSE